MYTFKDDRIEFSAPNLDDFVYLLRLLRPQYFPTSYQLFRDTDEVMPWAYR